MANLPVAQEVQELLFSKFSLGLVIFL